MEKNGIDFARVKSLVKFYFEGGVFKADFKGDIYTIPNEIICSAFEARAWKSGNVVKNKRQAGTNSMKNILDQAVNSGLIDGGEAWNIASSNDKARVNELKEQLPTVEKTAIQSDEDLLIGIMQSIKDNGQKA